MHRVNLNELISKLGFALLTKKGSFESLARDSALALTVDDLPRLHDKFHNAPPLPASLDPRDLRLGGWLSACQYAIFELIYNMGTKAEVFLRSIAFGEYDWTQATALEVLCRLYADGHLPEEIIQEIDSKLPGMRYETNLYLAQGVYQRSKYDSRFTTIINQLKSLTFQLALAEMGGKPTMSREELIQLGYRIIRGQENEDDLDILMELFNRNVPYPNGCSLFYYPENYDPESDDISEYDPTVEQVVDKCISYNPVNL